MKILTLVLFWFVGHEPGHAAERIFGIKNPIRSFSADQNHK